MFVSILNRLKLIQFRKTWRKYNSHNTTIAANQFDVGAVCVGKKYLWSNPCIKLGKR